MIFKIFGTIFITKFGRLKQYKSNTMKKTLKVATLVFAISLVAVSCKKKAEETPAVTTATEAPVAVQDTVVTASVVDPAIQQKLTDAVKDFPTVKVGVENGELTLTGDVTAEQARKIKMSVDALKLGKVNFKYNVKK